MQQSRSIAMTKWDGFGWKQVWTADGLGGSAWDQRPAQPNSMWRIQNIRKREKRCPGESRRIFNRVWGVSELNFFSDDDCSQQVDGGVPIGSGTIERYRKTVNDADNYTLSNAFDDDTNTEWGANCLLG